MRKTSLKHYIRPGDMITYDSTKAIIKPFDVGRAPGAEVTCTAPVIAVYPDFVIVQLRVVRDCANRWNIKSVNADKYWYFKERGGVDYVDCV